MEKILRKQLFLTAAYFLCCAGWKVLLSVGNTSQILHLLYPLLHNKFYAKKTWGSDLVKFSSC